ncbi:xanthine dehydrogenase family protein molybdopterin-binding subunit [Roseobacter sp. CCS2]|uniref:xanthine dehydrogenase family protein molybdopterin-binding subunit n=1 Tax=Roseobacter sp. CCS2 TaxID=391593 RepID=UPI0000F40354|nr:molybdopterin cofactor-binding domain-containing protein [Roseobacter sp. CCS2]EBA14010.1 Twin-arginine translocation pathway signal [Roseobacter sp. CCS2]
MGRIKTIARRSFLIGSAAIAGGVAFGVYAVRRTPDNPLEDDLAAGAATFNPWVLVDSEKVTLITPHADKGQGVMSSQAALIAEELDIEFGQFETSFGRPSGAYWNRGLSHETVPFAPTDERWIANTMRDVAGGAIKLLGMQTTGGSTSMPDSFDKLREAGAVARETLKLAASQQEGVPVENLSTANGAVILPDGRQLPYTSLAAAAATVEPVTDITLRPPSAWRLIGKPMQRLDIVAKSTGTQQFGIDLALDGMVHATVCTSPRRGGTLDGYDATEAMTMRGVSDVLEVTNGVAVVADNTWRAIQAINAIKFEWGPAPYPAEQADHWQTLEDSFTDARLDSTWRDDGDAASTLADGDIVEATYRSPYVAHAPLEPLNAIVLVKDDSVEIWAGHQSPSQVLIEVGKITGHDASQITFHNQFIGGSFGHRLESEFIKQATEIANQMRGTPVKLTYSREEDFAQDFPRHPAIGRARGKVDDGKVVAIDLEIAGTSVLTSQLGRQGISLPMADPTLAAGAWNNPYDVPHYRVRTYRAPELMPVSSWRAVGAPGAGFIFDTFLDELIHAAGADPIEERIRLMGHDVSRKVLEAVAEMSDWGGPLGENQAKGVAFIESFGVPTAEVVQVTNTDRGIKIDKVWVACDVGTIIDPINFENNVQGGVVFGLGHAMNCELTVSDGKVEQSNYHAHEAMRMHQCPEIFVRGLENGTQVRGIGEPPVPPVAPALGNAIFAATGQRIREMPFWNHVDFA